MSGEQTGSGCECSKGFNRIGCQTSSIPQNKADKQHLAGLTRNLVRQSLWLSILFQVSTRTLQIRCILWDYFTIYVQQCHSVSLFDDKFRSVKWLVVPTKSDLFFQSSVNLMCRVDVSWRVVYIWYA
jgi:hypothetical protein